jgi:putative glutamine amidotransferase
VPVPILLYALSFFQDFAGFFWAARVILPVRLLKAVTARKGFLKAITGVFLFTRRGKESSMAAPAYSPRIGIYGSAETSSTQSRGCALWDAGYEPIVIQAGGTPTALRKLPGCSWDELLEGLEGVVFAENRAGNAAVQAEEERLCEWCRESHLPLLAVDHGLHMLNNAFGGTLHVDLPKALPQALQHLHPPEPGDRHAINVIPSTYLAQFYGEGEIVVNSEHRRAVDRVARGFRISGRALDGVVEAIEWEGDDWFAMGVQWHPASASASGLDIQLFRGFLDACTARWQSTLPATHLVAA